MSLENRIGILIIGIVLSQMIIDEKRPTKNVHTGSSGNRVVMAAVAFITYELILGMQAEHDWNIFVCLGLIFIVSLAESVLIIDNRLVHKVMTAFKSVSALAVSVICQYVLFNGSERTKYMGIAVCFFITGCFIKALSNSGIADMSVKEKVVLAAVVIISTLIMFCIGMFVKRYEMSWILMLLIGGMAVIDILVFYLIGQLNEKNKNEKKHLIIEQKYALQQQYMESVYELDRQSHKLKHDVKNQLSVISNLILRDKENGNAEAYEYLLEYMDAVDNTMLVVHTGHDIIDAVINAKLQICYKLEIKTEISISDNISRHLSVKDVDLCCILGNVLDNAIEAEKNVKNGNKMIQIYMHNQNECIHFIVRNYIEQSVLNNNKELKTTKLKKYEHGYGTRIIKDTVNKYGGEVDFYEEDSYFCCSVTL